MSSRQVQRREFLKATAAGAGFFILPSGSFTAGHSLNDKLNIALIGCWGRGRAHMDAIAEENVVALCDVQERSLDLAAQRFPLAQRYYDWRKCLDHKGLDAVVICTPDHTHAFISLWAMNRGLHVYCEKPVGNNVHEARLMRETYLKNRHKIATQNGTQRHAYDNFPRVKELIRDGAIGKLRDVHAWGRRQLRRKGYLPAQGTPPEGLKYDLWLGPAHYHPYNPGYFEDTYERPGMNCLKWNMFWDFGSGQVGDMGSHTMDLVWNAIDAHWPTSAEAHGETYNPEVTPVELTATWEHPANDWRDAIRVVWYQGGHMPRSPMNHIDLTQIGHGAMFKGDKGYLICDFGTRLIIPYGKEADMAYYEPRDKEEQVPGIDHFQKEWINACKGSLKTTCDFDYSGLMTEQLLLGLVAYRVGQKISYDGQKGKVTNNTEANALLKGNYRKGWTLNG